MNASIARRIRNADLIIVSALRPARWSKRTINKSKRACTAKPLRFPVSSSPSQF